MQRGFSSVYILVGILVIAAIAGGAYFLGRSNQSKPGQIVSQPQPTLQPTSIPQPSPPPTDTKDWKIYTNVTYGYEIKYPPDKFIDCSAEDSFIIYDKHSNDTICAAGEGPYGGLSISKVNNATLANQSSYPECYSSKEEPIKVGGIDGTKHTNTLKSENNDCNKTIVAATRLRNYILLNNKGVSFQIVFNDAVNEQLKLTQTINQILSTFRFLP